MEELIRLKLKALDKPMVDSGFPYILTTCLNPEHLDKHPSFSINLESGHGKCFGCGFHVSDEYWVNGTLSEEEVEDLLRSNKYKQLKESFAQEEKESPVVFMPPKDKDVKDGWRGLTEGTIQTLNLYICNTGHYQNRVVFPMLNQYGNVCAFNTRALSSDITPKYKYSKGIPVQNLVYPPLSTYQGVSKNYIVVVEGIMDAISMWQDGIPAMLNFGVNHTIGKEKVAELLKNGVETIYIGLDNDKAGLAGTLKYMESDLTEYFTVKSAVELSELGEFYKSGCKDYNEYLEGRD